MLATSSELQDPGCDLNLLVSLLRQRIYTGEPFAADSFIQEADVYSAAPADLVRHHAQGMDLGEGKGMAWYFCTPADYHETPGARRRNRKVGGGRAGGTRWHVEKVVSILGRDNESVGAYKRTLSYVQKIKNPPGTARKTSSNKSLGWIMVEIELEQKEDPDGPDQQLVLCKVYRSPRTDAAEASVPCTPTPPPAAPKSSSCDSHKVTTECKTTLDYNFHSPGVGRKPALSARKPGTQCWPPMGGKIRSGLAIVKKGSVTVAVTVVMKFGGSSMKSADHMKEMAKLVFNFPEGGGNPVVVLSAMGKATTNLLVAAGKALSCGTKEASKIDELAITKEMHFRMIDDLGLDRSIVSGSLEELECVFMAIAVMQELTSKTREYIVSFGENLSTRIFSAYLNKLGKGTCQEWESYAVNTCGRGGTDLTAATIAREMGAREIQIWKDVDGVLTCDPTVCTNAIPLPYLTFDEAVELGLFGAQSMQLAMEGGISIKVKNLYNPQAPGTVITKTRDMSKCVLTSIVLRSNITLLNIERTRMVDQSGFLAMSFSTFRNLGISVDCVAISEGKLSMIVVPPKLSSRELVQLELDNVVEELQEISVVDRLKDRSVISVIGNTQMSAIILVKACNVLWSAGVNVQMISQGSSNSDVVKVSLVVHDSEAKDCVHALHSAFFENGYVSELDRAENKCQIPAYSSTSARSSVSVKRKVVDDHPEASTRQRTTTAEPSGLEEAEPRLPDGDNGDPTQVFQSISDDSIPPVTSPLMCYADMNKDIDMEQFLSQEMPIGGDDNGDWSKYFYGVFDHFDGDYDTNWVLSRGKGPSGVVAGVPEDDENPVLPEQPADRPAASGNYP